MIKVFKNCQKNCMTNYFFPTANGVKGFRSGLSCECFIDNSGKKVSSVKKSRFRCYDYFFIRGVLFFVFGLCVYFNLLKETCHSVLKEDEIKINKNRRWNVSKVVFINIGLVVVSFIVSFLLLGLVPNKIAFFLTGLGQSVFLINFVIAVFKVFIIIVLLLILRTAPIMQDFYKFNSTCNMSGGSIKEKQEHYHQPLNFFNFIVFSFIFSTFVITLVGINVNFWANWLINIAMFILILGFCFELLKLININNSLKKLCIITSFFVCVKPQTTQIEVARVVFMEIEKKENGEDMTNEKRTRAMVEVEMQTKLEKTGRYDKSDVDWIIATVLGKNRQEAFLTRSFDEKTYREIMKATDQRAQGKPVSSIFGFVDFYGMRFSINKKVLTPRQETEILVERALEEIDKIKKCEVLDLCTGSGAIAVSVAKNSDAKVTASDISKSALEIAKENALKNQAKVIFVHSDLFEGLKKFKKFDVIVSNPPYIRSLDIAGLDEEVKGYDPKISLDGGEDGLYFYREIAQKAPSFLNKNGFIFLEIGKGQSGQVKKFLEMHGFVDICVIKDYNKINRVIKARYGSGKRNIIKNRKVD